MLIVAIGISSQIVNNISNLVSNRITEVGNFFVPTSTSVPSNTDNKKFSQGRDMVLVYHLVIIIILLVHGLPLSILSLSRKKLVMLLDLKLILTVVH